MAGFVKIYGDRLLGSSLMDEAVETRWMFMCLAAAADENGYIRCQTVGVAARLANLTEPQAAKALEALSSPDPNSSTADHEGRRIIRSEGGWTLVNHKKYREMRTERQSREAARVKAYRERTRTERTPLLRKGSASLSASAGEIDEQDRAGSGALPGEERLHGHDSRVAGFHSSQPGREISLVRGSETQRSGAEGVPGAGIRDRAVGACLPAGNRSEFRSDTSDGFRRVRPANPLLQGRREDLELECLALVREVSGFTGEDPIDVIAHASGYKGAATTKLNPATMSDDRLANTVRDLRADAAELRRKHDAKAR